MKLQSFEQIDEKLYTETLANGLRVCILPKKGFSKTYVTFTTHYGSIDRHFVPLGEEDPIEVPDGIAHFLEHKMFEKEDGDVFQKFSQKGASANAYTSFTRTAYLFSSTNHVYENTETLLDFVQTPYFTEKSVEKEKGIIGQEITMYDDNPDWRLYFGTIENLYEKHPVKIDIAGTVESISHITAEHLYTCYNTFYHPSNMILFVVGAVDPEKMMSFIRENQDRKEFAPKDSIARLYPEESIEASESAREIYMDVQKPKVMVGIKSSTNDLQGPEMMKEELSIQLWMEMAFGRASKFYQSAYETSLIDDSFSFDFTLEKGYGFAIIGSDSPKPDELVKLIKQEISSSTNEWAYKEQDFERVKKKKIGQFLRALNSLEFIANQFTHYAFNGMELFDVLPLLEKLTIEDVKQSVASLAGDEKQTVFKVLPSTSQRDQNE
ncbi:EF-P 5-aminopentanol modification-associated protein YfmH [Paenisporosarcina cavernae]|uniref:Insulinase family protein n=1 Tax=Paenisporosarcina cavernae TaxID=2320858 RepID=A0A385YSL1_9BACL|nr:pitrilysin family protein [Paenisporosarcina cavernae]AYC29300.1 insulinase family protein [Paenisporosarcina cavernae]